ncbi:MAG: helix-turn-helix domain-containing protein [Deltaproteobacteria bacterium]|nr:helix-turn-helix domain-containing protein [Deltaproteobacteria bacterium]
MQDEVLTTEEAAEFLKLTPFTVRDYARRGILPARKVGKGWRFFRPDLVAWLRDYAAPPWRGKALRNCTWERTIHGENSG